MTESPLLKVTVLMPKVTLYIGEKEMEAAIEARIVTAANVLVGNYSAAEDNSCAMQPQHGWLNRVFEPGKKRKKAWSRSVETTSKWEKMLAKPVKSSRKFSM
jgi:hypothetical protein